MLSLSGVGTEAGSRVKTRKLLLLTAVKLKISMPEIPKFEMPSIPWVGDFLESKEEEEEE